MKKVATKIFNHAHSLQVEQAEIFITINKEVSVSIRNGQTQAVATAMPVGLGLRVIYQGRQGFSYTTDFADLAVVERAVKSAQLVAGDNYFGLSADVRESFAGDLQLFDPQVESLDVAACLQQARELEQLTYAQDKRISKTESVDFFTNISECFIFNTQGIEKQQKQSVCGGSVQVVAEQDGQSESGGSFRMFTHFTDYHPQLIARQAAGDAVNLLGAKTITSGSRQIILSAEVAGQFLAIFSQAFSADNYQKNKSIFNQKLGQKVLSEKLSIIDDGLLVKGLGSAYFDGEGISTTKTTLIENGVFKNILYDTYTAAKAQTVSSGNAQRGFKSLPVVGVNNCYLVFADQCDDLLKDFTGLVITRVMGLHTANPITGEFSFGAGGYWQQDGKRQYGIRNMAVAGSLPELFNNIEIAEKETLFLGSFGCPSLKVNNVNIAGE